MPRVGKEMLSILPTSLVALSIMLKISKAMKSKGESKHPYISHQWGQLKCFGGSLIDWDKTRGQEKACLQKLNEDTIEPRPLKKGSKERPFNPVKGLDHIQFEQNIFHTKFLSLIKHFSYH